MKRSTPSSRAMPATGTVPSAESVAARPWSRVRTYRRSPNPKHRKRAPGNCSASASNAGPTSFRSTQTSVCHPRSTIVMVVTGGSGGGAGGIVVQAPIAAASAQRRTSATARDRNMDRTPPRGRAMRRDPAGVRIVGRRGTWARYARSGLASVRCRTDGRGAPGVASGWAWRSRRLAPLAPPNASHRCASTGSEGEHHARILAHRAFAVARDQRLRVVEQQQSTAAQQHDGCRAVGLELRMRSGAMPVSDRQRHPARTVVN